ncbi:hypothetical protein [Moraxella ovis]|uniref:hypothetical protein n=1 Tax=Moraxella ovis TaxID=29433 RepID=UPI000D9033B1|nr:hypothetical protein [Moraxella ovis]SPX84289.1 Uncharacterised protein [Moraxella ovis]STZ31890.1 Uncharacterised protein [Moraxella ovis]
MELSARNAKVLDEVKNYAQNLANQNDEKAKLFLDLLSKENPTKSDHDFVRDYIGVWRLTSKIEKKQRKEKLKKENQAGLDRKALNAAKFGLGGFILSEMKNETDPKFKDLFLLIGMMSGLIDSQNQIKIGLINNSIQISIHPQNNELLNIKTTVLYFQVALETDDITYGFNDLPTIVSWSGQRPTINDKFTGNWVDDNIQLTKETAKWVSYVVFKFLELHGYLAYDAVNQKFIFHDGFGFKHIDPNKQVINYFI